MSRSEGPPMTLGCLFWRPEKALHGSKQFNERLPLLLAASLLKTVQSALLRVPYSKKEHFKKDSTLAVVFEAVACLF